MLNHHKSSIRALVEDSIARIERAGGRADHVALLGLLKATQLLRRCEMAMYADPQQEWPLVPPLKQVTKGQARSRWEALFGTNRSDQAS